VQNEPIKDNTNNINLKDNNCVLLPNGSKTETALAGSFAASSPGVEVKPFSELSKSEQIERFKREVGF
jgi:hypothetical protein